MKIEFPDFFSMELSAWHAFWFQPFEKNCSYVKVPRSLVFASKWNLESNWELLAQVIQKVAVALKTCNGDTGFGTHPSFGAKLQRKKKQPRNFDDETLEFTTYPFMFLLLDWMKSFMFVSLRHAFLFFFGSINSARLALYPFASRFWWLLNLFGETCNKCMITAPLPSHCASPKSQEAVVLLSKVARKSLEMRHTWNANKISTPKFGRVFLKWSVLLLSLFTQKKYPVNPGNVEQRDLQVVGDWLVTSEVSKSRTLTPFKGKSCDHNAEKGKSWYHYVARFRKDDISNSISGRKNCSACEWIRCKETTFLAPMSETKQLLFKALVEE